METTLKAGVFGSSGLLAHSLRLVNPSSENSLRLRNVFIQRKFLYSSVLRSSISGSDAAQEDAMHMFIKERALNGDFITKVSDLLWKKDEFNSVDSETSAVEDLQHLSSEEMDEDISGGFLKLVKTKEWVSGSSVAPNNKRLATKDWQNDVEKRKQVNLLKYEALKRELLLVTTAIGAACSAYCLVTLSVEAAASYAVGVLCSCSYLQLLYHHADNLSKEAIPEVFLKKKSKKIGIRSEDLKITMERTLNGSGIALSSPRLVLPAVVYGFWGLSNIFANDYFQFQLVPGMFGFFAYKAAALVQVYRDNEDLRMIFPDNEDGLTNS